MKAIAMRPTAVVSRALDLLAGEGVRRREARVLVVGASYKPGVRDVREAPAVRIMHELAEEGVAVSYHDPLVQLPRGRRSAGAALGPTAASLGLRPRAGGDAARPHDYEWLDDFEQVLDCTYQTPLGRSRALI